MKRIDQQLIDQCSPTTKEITAACEMISLLRARWKWVSENSDEDLQAAFVHFAEIASDVKR